MEGVKIGGSFVVYLAIGWGYYKKKKINIIKDVDFGGGGTGRAGRRGGGL